MVDEDDKYMIGSFFLVASTREEAQAFVDNDPFKKARITTTPFLILIWRHIIGDCWCLPSARSADTL